MERKHPKIKQKDLLKEIKRLLILNECYVSGRINEILYEIKKIISNR